MDKALEVAIEAARAAGEIALRSFTGRVEVEWKPDRTPVTRADREAERVIVEILRSAFPEWGFLAEESGASGGEDKVRWIIDPIDGTRNFVRGIPFWATLIGLEEHGEITLGVVHAPATGDLLYARKGEGAYANGQPVRVSRIADLAEATLLHASLTFLRGEYWDGFLRLVDATQRQRGFGDYFAYTFVTRGQADLLVEADLKPWDLAAVKILVEEAGGCFTDFAGRPTIYSGTALASNGLVHDQALRLLQGR